MRRPDWWPTVSSSPMGVQPTSLLSSVSSQRRISSAVMLTTDSKSRSVSSVWFSLIAWNLPWCFGWWRRRRFSASPPACGPRACARRRQRPLDALRPWLVAPLVVARLAVAPLRAAVLAGAALRAGALRAGALRAGVLRAGALRVDGFRVVGLAEAAARRPVVAVRGVAAVPRFGAARAAWAALRGRGGCGGARFARARRLLRHVARLAGELLARRGVPALLGGGAGVLLVGQPSPATCGEDSARRCCARRGRTWCSTPPSSTATGGCRRSSAPCSRRPSSCTPRLRVAPSAPTTGPCGRPSRCR